MIQVQLLYLASLTLTVIGFAGKRDWYQMHTSYGPISMDSGSAKLAKNGQTPTLFEEEQHKRDLYITIMNDPFLRYYFGADDDGTFTAKAGWTEAGNLSWNGCQLRSHRNDTVQSSLRFTADGNFEFYDSARPNVTFCVERVYPYRSSLAIAERLTCKPTSIRGSWKLRFTNVGKGTIRLKHGTTKNLKESRTDDWSHSVSTLMISALTIESFYGTHFPAGFAFRESARENYSTEWSLNHTKEWTVKLREAYEGKALWQFVFHIMDSCGREVITLLREYAITSNATVPPCCLPGRVINTRHHTSCISDDDRIEKTLKHCIGHI